MQGSVEGVAVVAVVAAVATAVACSCAVPAAASASAAVAQPASVVVRRDAAASLRLGPLTGLSGSKLTVQTGQPGSQTLSKFLLQGKPRMLNVVEDFTQVVALQREWPGGVFFGKASQTAVKAEGNATQAAQAWWAAEKGKIASTEAAPVAFWEALDSPELEEVEDAAWLCEFEVARQNLLYKQGFKAGIFSFAPGTPPVWGESTKGDNILKALLPAFQLAKKLGNLVTVHEFAFPTLAAGFDNKTGLGNWTGRYRHLYKSFLNQNKLADLPLVISQLGIDAHVANASAPRAGWTTNTGVTGYAQQLAWYDSIIRKDDYVQGAAIFLMDGNGGDQSFNVSPKLADLLIDHLNSTKIPPSALLGTPREGAAGPS